MAAHDIEKLVVQLSADFKSFEKSMARAQGVSNKQFNAIERRARQLNSNLDGIFKNTFRGLTGAMGGISALTGRAIGGLVMALPAATTSVMALVTAMRAGTLTAAGFTAALGPMGLLLGAAAGTLYVLSTRQDEADLAAEAHRKSILLLNQEIADLDYANKSAVESTRDKIKLDLEAAKAALVRAEAERESARAILEGQVMGRVRDPELGRKLIEKQMGNSLSLFTKQVELQRKRVEDLQNSLFHARYQRVESARTNRHWWPHNGRFRWQEGPLHEGASR